MKRFFEKYPIEEIIDVVLTFVEYCLPLLAGVGIVHLFLCGNEVSIVSRIIVYAFAIIVALCGFGILVEHRSNIAKQESELKELRKLKKEE